MGMTESQRMDILFVTFIVIFIATAVITLLGITEVIEIKSGYLTALVAAFLVELAGAVVAMYKQAPFFVSKSKTISESVRATVEGFDQLSDQIKDVIEKTDEASKPHYHGFIIRRTGNDIVAYRKMQTITGEELEQLPAEQRNLINTYEKSMDALRTKWHELWPKRINTKTGEIDEDVNSQLLTLVKGMKEDLIGIFDFLEQLDIYLEDHYQEVRSLIQRLEE
jgi:hypothetical protein